MFLTWDNASLDHLKQIEIALKANACFIQLRMKGRSYEEWLDVASKAKDECRKKSVTLILNDNVAVAKAVDADGVHLGKQDMHPDDARKLLGSGKLIGGTANTFEDVLRLKEAGVNYIGLGPYRFTETKLQLSPVLGLEGIREILQKCREHNIQIPIYIIGGVRLEDIKDIMKAGAYGVAVASAILKDPIPGHAIREMLNELEKHS